MLEQPECIVLARQLEDTLVGKTVQTVVAGASPHKFAFFEGAPEAYPALLEKRALTKAEALGPYLRLTFEDTVLLLRDGVNPRYYGPGEALPPKHQLLIEFEGDGALVCTVQMYGVMQAFPAEALAGYDNLYYRAAVETPSALSAAFTEACFLALCAGAKSGLSAKALLATEQRIPGIGNGVLQDILFNAGIHPKRKLETLDEADRKRLYKAVVKTMADMAARRGRDTEKDLFGRAGGYKTILSAKTWQYPCLACSSSLKRQAYLGGNVYFCPTCQPL